MSNSGRRTAEVILVLVGISLILFFGLFAEFIFRKFRIPDLLLLMLLGFALGPYVLGYITPSMVAGVAPIFTTFALLFLIYDGAFNIDLASFARGIGISLGITFFNFIISALLVAGVLYLFNVPVLICILTGFILGGVSSAFVIPLLKQLNVKGRIYSVLTLESAMTDVFCIVFALTTVEIIKLSTFNVQAAISQIASLFAIAGFFGIIAGILWIIISVKLFKEQKPYMITIAYLIMVYVLTELLGGNGAIAALFFGLVVKNSRQLTGLLNNILSKSKESVPVITATSKDEEFFYGQISFLLKTFFFVYIGMLFDPSNYVVLIIGGIIAVTLLFSRTLSYYVTKSFTSYERKLTSAIFARGLAAAAIVQIVYLQGISSASLIASITYAVIAFTIILSSTRVFMIGMPEEEKKAKEEKKEVKTAT